MLYFTMSKEDSKNQLYVSNLPSGATSERLTEAFKSYGEAAPLST